MHVLALKRERLHLLLLHMDGAEQTTVGREREGVPVSRIFQLQARHQ